MNHLFFNEIDFAIKTQLDLGNAETASFLSEVKQWGLAGSYSKYYKAKPFLELIGIPDSETAQLLGMKESTVRVTRRNLSKEIMELLGDDFFTKISQNGVKGLEDARSRFSFAQRPKTTAELLPANVARAIEVHVEDEESKEFTLNDCRDEVVFVVNASIPVQVAKVGNLDPEKIKFLCALLDGKIGLVQDRINLVGAITLQAEREIEKGLSKF